MKKRKMFYGKRGFAIEQVFVIGLFLIVFVVLVGLISYATQKAKLVDGKQVEKDMKVNGTTLIYDKCEEFLDKELDVFEFYDLFYFAFSGACGREVEDFYLINIAFPLNKEILERVAKDNELLDEYGGPKIEYFLDCSVSKNSRVFFVQNSALGSSEFLLFVNSMEGASVCKNTE